MIEAATVRRDRLAWQIARAVRDSGVKSYDDLSGRAATRSNSAVQLRRNMDALGAYLDVLENRGVALSRAAAQPGDDKQQAG